jgi:hypothetical protein
MRPVASAPFRHDVRFRAGRGIRLFDVGVSGAGSGDCSGAGAGGGELGKVGYLSMTGVVDIWFSPDPPLPGSRDRWRDPDPGAGG